MKKLLLLFINIIIVVSVYGQTTTFRTDLVLDKSGTVADRIYLRGNGSLLDFMSGDVVLTQSSNQLSLSGGNLSLGTNSLLLTGSIGATGARITKGWFTNLEITNLPTINGAALSTLFVPVTRTINTKPLSANITITAADIGLGSVTNESKTTMFTNPTFTNAILSGTITLGSTLLTSSATELNALDGYLGTTANLNYLIGSTGNIQSSLNTKISGYNSVLTGTTVVELLQIGQSDSALIIGAMENVGAGLTVRDADGNQVPYNNPPENTISILTIPEIPTIYSGAGDTSNYPVPGKMGNIYINTSGSKIYISKSAVRGGWVILN